MSAGTAPPRVARVVPDVTGLDKEFDYLVPADLGAEIRVGSVVRVPLHGRRVRGWVVALDPPDQSLEIDRMRPIAKVSSRGPAEELIELARWASVRWGAGRLRPFLVSASPPANVAGLPPRRRAGARIEPVHPGAADLLAQGGGVVRLPPTDDAVPILAAAARLGPTLVVVPVRGPGASRRDPLAAGGARRRPRPAGMGGGRRRRRRGHRGAVGRLGAVP